MRRAVHHRLPSAVLALALAAALATASRAEETRPVRVVGSSTMFAAMTLAAERFARTGGGRAPVVEATGTGGGFKAFCAGLGLGTPDVAAASRPMAESERRACAEAGVGAVVELPLAAGGVVLARARGGEPLALSRGRLRTAIAAQVEEAGAFIPNTLRHWREVWPALPAAPIRVYGPPPTSGTRDLLAELVLAPGCVDGPLAGPMPEVDRLRVCTRVREDGPYIEAGENDDAVVRRLTLDPGAVGLIGFGALERHRDLIEAAAIDGVAPTAGSVRLGVYPLGTTLRLYVKAEHLRSLPELGRFLRLLLSEAVSGEDGPLARAGLPPFDAAARADTRARLEAALAVAARP